MVARPGERLSFAAPYMRPAHHRGPSLGLAQQVFDPGPIVRAAASRRSGAAPGRPQGVTHVGITVDHLIANRGRFRSAQ